jgi:hypothetical protein
VRLCADCEVLRAMNGVGEPPEATIVPRTAAEEKLLLVNPLGPEFELEH